MSLFYQLKLRLWLFICWWVRFFGIRGKDWYREHKSRVRHSLDYLKHQKFDWTKYGKAILDGSRIPDHRDFVPLSAESNPWKPGQPRVIAFYLPQYHQFKENNEWHGKGFTEWTNVTKAVPQFLGHHQPQLPIDVGFYDLSTATIMQRQVELARQYGLFGFCFHYYAMCEFF